MIDVLIIGSGLAGLTTALKITEENSNCKILLLCKSSLGDGSSIYAQGGIAAVMNNHYNDSVESHIQDTIKTGDGLCNFESVSFTMKNAKYCIKWLIDKGAPFNLNKNKHYHLTVEGGHSHRRIFHIGDYTGQSIQKILIHLIKNNNNITICEYHKLVDLIVVQNICIGVYALNLKNNNIIILNALSTVIATGGASNIYHHSTNNLSYGEGIAIAYRAGCRVANLEFNQFHPTCFYYNKNIFLLSEALRGEGAYLRLPNGKRFMLDIDKRAELASRDIVTRAIFNQMKQFHLKYVFLDITHKNKSVIKNHFPMIYNKLLQHGLDITKHQIPVIPSAHYTCGGIMVNNLSQTDIIRLYAVGEVSYTGLHGANRLASNSLIECLVYAFSAAKDITNNINIWKKNTINYTNNITINKQNSITYKINFYKNTIQTIMENNVGIIRNNLILKESMKKIKLMEKQFFNTYKNDMIYNNSVLELQNMFIISKLIIKSAINRKESRGLHYNADYLNKNKLFLQPTILSIS